MNKADSSNPHEPSAHGPDPNSKEGRLKKFKEKCDKVQGHINEHNSLVRTPEPKEDSPGGIRLRAMTRTFTEMGTPSDLLIAGKKIPPYYMHRGPFGETLLHVACLFGEYAIAKEILEQLRNEGEDKEKGKLAATWLVNQPYTRQPYLGETALHIAIAKGNLKMVLLLLEHDAGFKKRCVGRFFRHPRGFYVGELPLSFAACVSTANERNKEIFNELQKNVQRRDEERKQEESYTRHEGGGKEPERESLWLELLKMKDEGTGPTQGNTLLHVLVLRNNIDMYAYIAQKCPEEVKKVEEIRNTAQMTPLTLCAEQGNPEFFQFLVMRKKLTHWEYGAPFFLPYWKCPIVLILLRLVFFYYYYYFRSC